MPSYSATDYLLDRANIQDTINRMAWYIDRKDWDKVATVFSEKVTMDYSSMLGGEPYETTPVAQAQTWKGMLEYIDATLHGVNGIVVELPQPSADTSIKPPTEASATCSPLVFLRRDAAQGGAILQNGGAWKFKFTKSAPDATGNPWRISFMKADLLFTIGNSDVTKNPKTGKGWV
ncbi:hypothetical protein B0H11DRAFT_1948611 [Mycena galericulata]|nr:hypothetical protein B0H11DRAFT_1948611 [Mycena galericulata]